MKLKPIKGQYNETWFALIATHSGFMSIHASKGEAQIARNGQDSPKKHRIIPVLVTPVTRAKKKK